MKTVDKYQFNEEICTVDDGVPTFVAHHTILKRDFRLKMVTQGTKNEKENYNYLIKQAQVLKKLVHPNIYKCHKLLRSKNNFYVIYDNIQGQTLQQALKTNLPLQSKLIIIKQVIETLLLIHECRFAYLGLKSSNILVQDSLKIILKNFGHAEQFQEQAEVIDLVAFQGQIDKFTPPELEKGKVYRRSDFYSLGQLVRCLFQKQIESGWKQPRELCIIKYQKERIYVELSLDLLRELASKLTIKNYFERSDFFELIKTRQGSVERTLSFTSSSKNISQHEIKSAKNFQLPQVPQLQSSKSFKNILGGDKKEVQFGSIEQIVLFVVKQRSFGLFIVNLSASCLRNREASIGTVLPLCFVLMKKATTVISQLARLVKQGSNNEISINPKMMGLFKKTPAYEELLLLTTQEMSKVQKGFQDLLAAVKALPQLTKNQALLAEMKYEKINYNFIKRAVLEVLLQLSLLPTEDYLLEYSGNTLYYLYLLSLLSDYDTYRQMYEHLFTEGLQGFQNEPFIQQLGKIDGRKVVELIEYNISVLFSEQNYRSPLAVKNTLTVK